LQLNKGHSSVLHWQIERKQKRCTCRSWHLDRFIWKVRERAQTRNKIIPIQYITTSKWTTIHL
jgi:hypothetical protein